MRLLKKRRIINCWIENIPPYFEAKSTEFTIPWDRFLSHQVFTSSYSKGPIFCLKEKKAAQKRRQFFEAVFRHSRCILKLLFLFQFGSLTATHFQPLHINTK